MDAFEKLKRLALGIDKIEEQPVQTDLHKANNVIIAKKTMTKKIVPKFGSTSINGLEEDILAEFEEEKNT